MIEYRNLRVALLGAGSVGAQVAALLLEHGPELANRAGAGLELVGVAVRDLGATRTAEIPKELLTTDAESLILGADIVIELMGGLEPARTLILQALNSGADVITGNKALLATHGPELFEAAEQVGAQLYYEAAVAGAIPIIRPLRDSLAGDRIKRILGIVNGTTNFILDRMDTAGESLEAALATATALGYAEKSDPSADIEGYDAAQKTAILASLAFHTTVPLESVHREGITGVTLEQVQAAQKAGYVVKLLAICERLTDADGVEGVSARVYPARSSARRRPWRQECGLHRGRSRGRSHVLRRRCRRDRDRFCSARRPRLGRSTPCDRRTGCCRVDTRQPAHPADLPGDYAVPDHSQRGRCSRRARGRRRTLQRARGVRRNAHPVRLWWR
jgi:homoserine dehydrogenase